MKDARYCLGNLEGGIRYREVAWEEFHQAWQQASLVGVSESPEGHYVCGPHARGFYFHDGAKIAGTCYIDGSTPDSEYMETGTSAPVGLR